MKTVILGLLDSAIAENASARNTYGFFGTLMLLSGLALTLWTTNDAGPISVVMGALFLLAAAHAETLRRRLDRKRKEVA